MEGCEVLVEEVLVEGCGMTEGAWAGRVVTGVVCLSFSLSSFFCAFACLTVSHTLACLFLRGMVIKLYG